MLTKNWERFRDIINNKMKTIIYTTKLLFITNLLMGGNSTQEHTNHHNHSTHHAPIGVHYSHTHHAAEFMLSLKYMTAKMKGHQSGTSRLSNDESFATGFNNVVKEMDMEMYMIGLMWAPTDNLTLFGMGHYIFKDMTLEGRGGHGAHGHGGHSTTTFGHSSEGWGDIKIGGLYNLFKTKNNSTHFGVALSIPTGDEATTENGNLLPYGMNLGSGTYDLIPSLTWNGHSHHISYGAQISSNIHLEDSNSAGYSFGDKFEATAWSTYGLSDNVNISGRVTFTSEDSISGRYNQPHLTGAPPRRPENFGGETIELGIGYSLDPNFGRFQTPISRVAIELLAPVYQNKNGIGLHKSWSVVVGFQTNW